MWALRFPFISHLLLFFVQKQLFSPLLSCRVFALSSVTRRQRRPGRGGRKTLWRRGWGQGWRDRSQSDTSSTTTALDKGEGEREGKNVWVRLWEVFFWAATTPHFRNFIYYILLLLTIFVCCYSSHFHLSPSIFPLALQKTQIKPWWTNMYMDNPVLLCTGAVL